jgi:hypothetical protein
MAVIGVLAWKGYDASGVEIEEQKEEFLPSADLPGEEPTSNSVGFTCDGRIYCSQMTSCAEATYFLRHCPGVKMDGGGDGVPCESQWCGDR